jgi:repressor of nif and glnA expression
VTTLGMTTFAGNRSKVRVMVQDERDTERKVMAILKVLSESSESLGSITIARELESHGVRLSERAVRYHLRITDERGFTRPVGRDGRMVTPQGLQELNSALASEQVGFIIERLELLAFQTTFDPQLRSGQVGINASLFPKDKFKKALRAMRETFSSGLCVSEMVGVAAEGEKLGGVVIPEGKIGLATVCSAVINGVLLKAGIPMDSKFGGILEVRNSTPRRFVAIINYAGTSLDPSGAYIKAKMTQVREAAATGTGRILANFREVPAPAKSQVESILAQLKAAGIGGVVRVGETSEPLCQVPVSLNKIGIILLGGMNPVAAAEEAGIEADNVCEAGTAEFESLVSFWDL